MKTETIVINLFGGPGCSKSSFCASIFAQLKWLDINCEMALEFAKDLVWEGNLTKLKDQFYVFGHQYNRIFRLNGKLDVIITDSPLLNSVVYDVRGNQIFKKLIIEEHNSFNNMNFFIHRAKPYNPNGRVHTYEEALELDKKILDMLNGNDIPFEEISGLPENTKIIVDRILKELGKNQ